MQRQRVGAADGRRRRDAGFVVNLDEKHAQASRAARASSAGPTATLTRLSATCTPDQAQRIEHGLNGGIAAATGSASANAASSALRCSPVSGTPSNSKACAIRPRLAPQRLGVDTGNLSERFGLHGADATDRNERKKQAHISDVLRHTSTLKVLRHLHG